MSAYFFGWDYTINKQEKNCMTTSESKGRFFNQTNRFKSIRITNRIDSNRELECSRSAESTSPGLGSRSASTSSRVVRAETKAGRRGTSRSWPGTPGSWPTCFRSTYRRRRTRRSSSACAWRPRTGSRTRFDWSSGWRLTGCGASARWTSTRWRPTISPTVRGECRTRLHVASQWRVQILTTAAFRFLLQDWLNDSPDFYCYFSAYPFFTFQFFCFTLFSCRFRAVD